MAKKIERLSAVAVVKANAPGLYPDGAGLYLRVGRGGAKSWVLRYMLSGKAREMGFGGLTKVSLAEARKKAVDARLLLSKHQDPLTAKCERTAAQRVDAARSITFDQCADAYIKAHQASWKNAKHRQQWKNTLTTYCTPVFGSVSVADVDVAMVTKVIEPLWSTKTETANRVRGRIEAILDWAKVRGFRAGENPARWRGHLDHLLPARSKMRKIKHHAALSYREIGTFMAALRSEHGTAAAALEFLILTAARTGEVIRTRWPEIDRAEKIWTVPGDRMKGGREHRVPLTSAALGVLDRMSGQGSEYVFPGAKSGAPLSNMAMLVLLGRMGRGDITAHGFRSSFRDWTAERTSYPREIAEAALAHVVGDKTEAAYQRGDLLEKRRRLMDAWAAHCAKPAVTTGAVLLLPTSSALRPQGEIAPAAFGRTGQIPQ